MQNVEITPEKVLNDLLVQFPFLTDYSPQLQTKDRISKDVLLYKIILTGQAGKALLPVIIIDNKVRSPFVAFTPTGSSFPLTKTTIKMLDGTATLVPTNHIKQDDSHAPNPPVNVNGVMGTLGSRFNVKRASAPKAEAIVIFKEGNKWLYKKASITDDNKYEQITEQLNAKEISSLEVSLRNTLLKEGAAVLDGKRYPLNTNTYNKLPNFSMAKIATGNTTTGVGNTFQQWDLRTGQPTNNQIWIGKEGWASSSHLYGVVNSYGSMAKLASSIKHNNSTVSVIYKNKLASKPVKIVSSFNSDEIGKKHVTKLASFFGPNEIWEDPIYTKVKVKNNVMLAPEGSLSYIPVEDAEIVSEVPVSSKHMVLRKTGSQWSGDDNFDNLDTGDAIALAWMFSGKFHEKEAAANVPLNMELKNNAEKGNPADQEEQKSDVSPDSVDTVKNNVAPYAKQKKEIADVLIEFSKIPRKALVNKIIKLLDIYYIQLSLDNTVKEDTLTELQDVLKTLVNISVYNTVDE